MSVFYVTWLKAIRKVFGLPYRTHCDLLPVIAEVQHDLITDKLMSVFYVTWLKAIRKVFGLPYRTHCDLLPVIAECKHIETQLLCRLVKFVNGAISSHNVKLNLIC